MGNVPIATGRSTHPLLARNGRKDVAGGVSPRSGEQLRRSPGGAIGSFAAPTRSVHSFRPSGALTLLAAFPGAHAPGYILTPPSGLGSEAVATSPCNVATVSFCFGFRDSYFGFAVPPGRATIARATNSRPALIG